MTFQNEAEAEFWRTAFNQFFGALVAADCAVKADDAVELYRERAAELKQKD